MTHSLQKPWTGSNPSWQISSPVEVHGPRGMCSTSKYSKDTARPFNGVHLSYGNSRKHGLHRTSNDLVQRVVREGRVKKAGASPGGQIMIHGQKNGFGWLSGAAQQFDWTNGCVALSNADMEEVWKAVRPGTPIELRP